MFNKGKHIKKSTNKKRINILLSVLLVICLVFVGTVLGKYIVDKTIGEKINLNIAGTPQGNVLIGDAYFEARDENDNPIPMEGFAYQIQQLMDNNGKTLGDVTKIVFDTAVPSGIDTADTTTKIDVSHGGREKIFAYYNSTVDASTVYVVPEELPTDGISYPMMAHEDAAAMFAGLYNLKTIEGLENVFLDSITTASEMFTGCRALTAVDLSHWTAEKLTDMQSMFEDCTSLKSLDLTSFNTANVLTMRSTFSDCSALETVELDKEKFLTDNVTDMSDMFGNCNSLKAIDVSGFNTANVIDMSFMFSGCESLKTLDVSGFDTSSLEYMSAMFCNCALLENIDVSGFKTNNVTDMSDVFLGCTALKSLDLSKWDTSNVTTMWRMFQHCSSLKKLDLSTFNTTNVTDMSSMFSNCTSLNKLYLTGWNTENVTNMYEMFQNCSSLEKLDLSSFNTSNVTTMRHMFAECGSLQTIYVSNDWSTASVVNTEDDGDDYTDEFEGAENELFTECWSLVGGQGTAYYDIADEYSDNYDADNYDDKKYAVIDKAQELQQDGTYGEKGYLTLYEAYTLTNGFTFSTAFNSLQSENMDATTITFGSYNELKGTIGDIWNDETVSYEIVDDKGQGTIRAYLITDDYGTGIYVVSKDSSVIFANKDCSYMFDTLMSMVSLTNIWGLNNVDTRNTTNMGFMFSDNTELIDMDVSGFDTSNVTDMTAMFSGLYNLSWLDVSNFDTSNVTNMYGMFAYCESLYSLDVSGFDTSNVTNMQIMFDCVGLTTLDLSNWDTSKVTNMMSMFDGCENLQTIYAGAGWNTDNVTNHEKMFKDCTALVGGQGTSWAAMSTEDPDNYLNKKYALIDAAREPNGAKGYLTDADYGTKSKILLPGGEFNAELAALLDANADVTKVQFSRADDIYDFYEIFGFDSYDDTAWTANADAILDVARSGNISAFVAGDTVYILAKEVDYDDQYNSVIYVNADSANMFRHNVGDETAYIPSGRLTAIDGLSLVDTRNTIDMSYMFAGSSNLATVDLRSFNTAGVTNMSYMFYGCNSIGGLSLSSFDTGKVTDMSYMFYDCDSITALKLTDWDVRNVTNMNSMFYSCDKLNTLNLTGWNTSFVTDMGKMFYGNPALTTIYVDESWKTGRVDESTDMFTGSTAIVGGQGTTFDEDYTDKEYAVIDRLVSDGAKGYLTYEEAYTLISGPDFSWMLWDGDGKDEYYGLSEDTIEWEGFDGGDVRITKIVFGSYDEYKDTLGLTSWDDLAPGIALDAEQEGNIRLYIPDFDWSNTQGDSYDQTYYVLSKGSSKIIANEDCYALLRSGPGWEEAYGLPWPIHDYHLKAIEGLDKLDTRYVTDMSMMFEYFAGESLDLSSFDTSNVTDMSYMFNNCGTLTSLDVTGFDTSNVTNMSGMFHYCSELETIDVSKFETGKVTDMSNMFYSMTSLTALNVSSFDTSKVTDMSNMFAYIYADKLDISSFSTAGYPYIDGMFYGCMNTDIGKYMTTIYASELWDPDKVRVDEYGYSVFGDSEMLVGGEGSTYAETAATDSDNDYIYARIDTKVSAGVPGLFTDKNAAPTGDFTLKAGTEVNAVIAASGASKVQFGSWADYGKVNGFEWSDTSAVTLDVNDEGTIKAFVKDDTIYILSGGTIYANEDSSHMFQHNRADADVEYQTGYIEQGRLTEINGLDKINTSRVENMSSMFMFCTKLTKLDVTSFDTSKVTDMSFMFRDCETLTTLDVSNFDTSQVTNMHEMFRFITKVTTLDLSSFDTSNVTDMQGMFHDSTGLTTIKGYENFDTNNVLNMSYMFKSCTKLTSIDISKFNTSKVENMSYMFHGCNKLETLTFGDNFDTNKVKNMRNMFAYCYVLTSLDLSHFDTSNVEDMQHMFHDCTGLTELDVSSFNTTKVTSMAEMFRNITQLTELDISSFDTANVTDMSYMFWDMQKVKVLDLSKFDTAKVADMTGMFGDCASLTTIYAGDGWNMDNVQDERTVNGSTDYMFTYRENATRLTNLTGGAGTKWSSTNTSKTYARVDGGADKPGYLTYKVTLTTGTEFNSVIKDLFTTGVTKLRFDNYNAVAKEIEAGTLTLDGDNTLEALWNASTAYVDVDENGDGDPDGNIRAFVSGDTVYVLSKGYGIILANEDCSNMFKHNLVSGGTTYASGFIPQGQLTAIDGLDKVNTSKVKNMSHMFEYCISLTELDVTSFDTSNVTDMSWMFRDCSALTTLDVSGLETGNVTNMQEMFRYIAKVETLDLSSFDTSKVTNMQGMFQDCDGLTSITGLGTYNTAAVQNMSYMFKGCDKLSTLTFGDYFKTDAVTTMQAMFQECSGLTSLDLSQFNTGEVKTMYGMLFRCSGLKSLIVPFDTKNVEDMALMFHSCSGLTSLDVSSFDTKQVKSLYETFRGCSGLTSLDVTNFNTSNVTDTRHTFRELNITTLDLSSFDTSKVDNMSNMFNGCSKLKTIYVSDLWSTESVTVSPTMFYGCSALVGGEGTTLADVYATDSVNYQTATYARIDKAITGDEKGYLTDKNAPAVAQLTTGSAFNAVIRNMFSTSVTKLQFGTYNDFAASDSTLANAYNASTTFVDVNNVGLIRVFTSGDTVYVLSDGDRIIYANPDSSYMFAGQVDSTQSSIYGYLKEINGLEVVNTSKVTTMLQMFYYCSVLTSLDVSNFDTSSVTNMHYMFHWCRSLTSLDVSSFDTSGVSDMFAMFGYNVSLTSLDVSNFDTSSVKSMEFMFLDCNKLTTLNLSNFDTSSVTNMKNMFQDCTSLKKIYVSGSWTVEKVTTHAEMFKGCTALVGSSGTKFDSSHIDKAYAHIDGGTDNPGYLSIYYTLNSGMSFQNDIKYAYNAVAAASDTDIIKKIKKIYIGDYNTYASTVEKITIYGSSERYSGEPAGIDYDSNTTDNLLIFYDPATDYVYVLAKGAYISANDDCYMMFRFMENLTEIVGLENLDTSGVTEMNSMFLDCTSLTTLDLSGFNTASVTSMGAMFSGCSALTSLDLSSFNTANVTSMGSMFYNCSSLQTIYAHNWDTNDSGYMMFYNCTSLKGGSGTAYSYENDNDATYAHIDGGTANPGYFTAPAQNANAAAVSLDSEDATEADGDNQNTDTAEPAADSTVEAILPDAQAKEEIESEQDADNSDTEE